MSTDDRINEILEKSKIKNPITSGPDTDDGNEEDDTYNSWKNSWNQLIEGVGASPGSLLESQENSSPEKDPKPQIGKKKPNLDASDSFEISEGDFEVILRNLLRFISLGGNICSKKKSRKGE